MSTIYTTDTQATAWVDQRDVQAYCPKQSAHWCANFIDDNAAEIEDIMHAAAAQFIKKKGQLVRGEDAA